MRWRSTVSDGFGKIARWKLPLSKLEFRTARLAGIKNQTADHMWRAPIGGTYKTKLYDDIPILAIVTDMFSTDETESKQEGRENYNEPTEQEFNLLVPEKYVPAN